MTSLLNDYHFVMENTDEDPADIAYRLGCPLEEVVSAFMKAQRVGATSSPWNRAEQDIIQRFYGLYPAAYLARVLGRTTKAVRSSAAKNKLKGRGKSNPDLHSFLQDYHEFIEENAGRWLRLGLADCILRLKWRPSQSAVDCEGCALRDSCHSDASSVLPCEALSIEELVLRGEFNWQ